MTKRMCLLIVALLTCVVLVAGCGGGDDDASAPTVPDVAVTTNGDDDGGVTVEAGEDGTTVETPDVDGATQQAIEACKQQVEASPVSDDVKADLETICDEAASGDELAVREASLEVCRKIIEENVPEGPSRDQALAACEQNIPTP